MRTPGPWIQYGRTIGSEVGGRMIVAAIDGTETGSWQLLEFDSPNRKQAMADLAFIVTACNSHDKLLEALKFTKQVIEEHPDFIERDGTPLEKALDRIDAAIHKAEAQNG